MLSLSTVAAWAEVQNCRCLYLPVTDWENIGIPERVHDDSQRPAVKHASRTAHHRDGATSTRFKVVDGRIRRLSEIE